MARLPRYYVPNQPQHIIQRGNNRTAIFFNKEDYKFYRDCFLYASNVHQLNVHAYVLMTNHVHILATPGSEAAIPKVLQSIGRRYVQYFNNAYNRTGTLWEGRYKATLIDSDEYLLTCSRYIELNPVRAGMVQHPKQYEWSSYRHNATEYTDDLITHHDIYLKLGKNDRQRESAYRALFKSHITDKTLLDIRDSTNKGWALGGKTFLEELEKDYIRRAKPCKRGRPKKDTNK